MRRSLLVLSILSMIMALALGTAVSPAAGQGKGNSEAAHVCKQGGYQTLIGYETGTGFRNTGECASFAAQGGWLVPAAAAPCLGDGYLALTGTEGGREAFSSAAACIAHVEAGGTLFEVAPPELSPIQRCALEAQALGLDPQAFTGIVAGDDGPNEFGSPGGATLICGFGGDDSVGIMGGDVFLGGPGNDQVGRIEEHSAFYGGDGDDLVYHLDFGSTFYGGSGNDTLSKSHSARNTFHGGSGWDTVLGEAHGTLIDVEDPAT